MAIVNVPQGLATSALTTASPRPARATMTINNTATAVAVPVIPSDLRACDFREGAAVAAQGSDQDDEILHRAGQHGPDHNPEESRQEPELGRQHRTQQRPGAGNGREMVSEEHVFVRGIVIGAVFQPKGRGAARIIQLHDAPAQKSSVKPVGQHVKAPGSRHQPEPVDLLVGIQQAGDKAEGHGAQEGNENPRGRLQGLHGASERRANDSCVPGAAKRCFCPGTEPVAHTGCENGGLLNFCRMAFMALKTMGFVSSRCSIARLPGKSSKDTPMTMVSKPWPGRTSMAIPARRNTRPTDVLDDQPRVAHDRMVAFQPHVFFIVQKVIYGQADDDDGNEQDGPEKHHDRDDGDGNQGLGGNQGGQFVIDCQNGVHRASSVRRKGK